jgi:diguanylate cyclase (GGDEF)-like protein
MLLLFAGRSASAQPARIESLVARAEALHATSPAEAERLIGEALAIPRTAGDDAARAHALLRKCWWGADPKANLERANEGLALVARAVHTTRHAQLLSCRGNALDYLGRNDEAARDYADAIHEAEQAHDQQTVVDALLQLGYLEYGRGDLNDALIHLQRAYAVAMATHNDAGARGALDYIAHVYADLSVAQYDKAIEYYRQLLTHYEGRGDRALIADALFNIGSTYDRKGDLNAALAWYRRALAAEESLGRRGEAAYVKRSIGITLAKIGRPDEALPLLDDALRTFIDLRDDDRIAEVRQSRGIAYRKVGRLDPAIVDLSRSADFFRTAGNKRFLEKSMDELAQAYAAAHRWEDAFRARNEDAALQRELATKLREEHTSRLRVQFDTEKKEQDNRALQRENDLRARSLAAMTRVQRLQKIILGLGGFIILGLIFFIIREVRIAQRMRITALTDELTRLPNRRRIVAEGDVLVHRAVQEGATFSIIAFDIDHFKRVNDTWGHAAGDIVLQRIAHACRHAVRPSDNVGRTGGEEFTVLLPATKMDEALKVAERLRAAVAAIDVRDIDPDLTVTISLGVAEWTQSDTTLAKLAGRADAVLYRAKEHGRNRVERAVA